MKKQVFHAPKFWAAFVMVVCALCDAGGATFNCPFGLATTSDGGFAIGGNNNIGDEDYYILKLRSDCQNSITYDIPNGQTITGNVTWNTPKKVKGKIIVSDGATLTIDNTYIEFASSLETNDYQKLAANSSSAIETKIIVQPGGKLVLQNNAELRGLYTCNKGWMWEGIEVWGDPDKTQTPANQGSLVMSSGAFINNAILGIAVCSKNYDADGEPSPTFFRGGGIVNAIDCGVFSCRRSLWFSPYKSGSDINVSRFQNTAFQTYHPMADENYIDINGVRLGPYAYVSMLGVRGMRFYFCSFKTFVPSLTNAYGGIGIVSYDADAYVYADNVDYNPITTTFENLYRGIHAIFPSNITNSYVITGNVFQNVRYSIYMNSAVGTDIYRNLFNIPASAPISLTDPNPYGVLLTGSTNNTVRSNKFNGLLGIKDNYGVLTDNSDMATCVILGNKFSNLLYGTQTQGNNPNLTIRCNDYSDQGGALAINPSSSGVILAQGACGQNNRQAGNKFMDVSCSTSPGRHIEVGSGVSFLYRCRPSEPFELPTCNLPNSSFVENCLQVNPSTCSDVPVMFTSSGSSYSFNRTTNQLELNGNIDLQAVNRITDPVERIMKKNELMRYHQFKGNSAGVMSVLASENTAGYQKIYAMAKAEMNQIGEARALHNQLLREGKIDNEHHKLQNMLMDLQEGNKKLKDLNRGQLQIIRNMAEGNSSVKFKAQSILSFVLGESYPDVIEKFSRNVTGSNPDMMLQQKPVVSNTASLIISPNPTKESININYSNADITDDAQIIITDIFGKVMKVTLSSKTISSCVVDVSTLANGTYLCTLLVNNKTASSSKFTIIK